MPADNKPMISRRGFMKLTGAASALAAAGSPERVLHALVAKKEGPAENHTRNVFSACDMCFNKCGLIARVEGGVVKKLDPNPKSLKSRGMLCARGNAGVKQLYDPDRLKYPLLRKGQRGEGKWQRLSWNEALDHAAEQMEKIGQEYTRCGFLFMAGTDMQSTFVHRFAEVYGSYNVISHESNCLLSRNRAFLASSACSGVLTRDPVVPAMFESKPVFWIVKELARRLDLAEHFDFTIEDFRKAQLKDLPEVARALKEDGVYNIVGHSHDIHGGEPFKTRSQKIELFSSRYEENGIDPMPVYTPPKEVPQDHFRIVVGRNAYITQSASTNNALLWELEHENWLWIHPASAQRFGIRQGDTVAVESPAGRGRLKARLTDRTRPDTVYMDTGYGVISKGLSKIFGKGACIAEVLEDYADDISGNMAMHETIVRVRKV